MFGNPRPPPGGLALDSASVRLDVRRIETLKQVGTVGSRTRVSVKKTRSRPFRQAEFDICIIKVSAKKATCSISANMNIIEKLAAFYSFDGARLRSGSQNAEFLINSPQVAAQIQADHSFHHAAVAPDIP
jgi:RecA/RadA recombinase